MAGALGQVALAVVLSFPSLAVAATMGGNVTLYPSGWPPPYFSGTNCRIVATVYTSAPAWLTDAQVSIDGVQVRSYTDPGTGSHTPYKNWSPVLFESSFVMDGQQHDFKLTGHDNQGGSLTQHWYAKAYNQAYVLGNSTLTYGITAKSDVGTQVAAMNHTTTTSSTVAKASILSLIPSQTAFYIYTHAGPGWFNDCPNTGTVSASDLATAVASKTSSQPPYNFVHIDGCNSCGSVGSIDYSLANAFGISGTDDRAFLGWLTAVKDASVCEQRTQTVWANLKSGKTIQKAVDDATAVITPLNADGSTAVSKILGDSRTTLHATYFLGAQGSWHD